MAQRLHARGSARRRRRRLRQIGNPTLIAQQRREGAGGGREGRPGAVRGSQPRRPKLPSAGWRLGKQVAGRSEPEPPGGRRRAGAGSPAPPGALSAPASAASPAADPGDSASKPALQLATSPGLRGAEGRGTRAATNGREVPAPPPPPQHASRPRGGVGSSPGPHRRPARRAPTRDGGGSCRALLAAVPQAQASPPLAGPSRILATRRLGAAGRPMGPQG